MIARAGTGWQYALADLSLILFLTTAAALGEPTARAQPRPPATALPVLAEPVAVWRAASGGPSLATWLATQPADPRLRLTLVAAYAPGGAAGAFKAAESLLATAGPRPSRLVLELAVESAVTATLTWDVAQPLQPGSANQGASR